MVKILSDIIGALGFSATSLSLLLLFGIFLLILFKK